jgi:hypothetical protein
MAATAVLLAGPAVLAFFSGGFFDQARLWAGVIAMALVVLVGALAPRPLPVSRAGRLALAGLALLALLTCLSFLWAPIAADALDDGQRVLLYLAFTVAAVALLRPRASARAVEPALGLGGLVVVGFALSERLLPGLVSLTASPSAAGRLEQPVTYWNALGAIAAIAITACARMAGDPSRPDRERVAAAAAAVPLGVGLYLTFSRGAIGVALAGLALLLVLSPTTAQARALALTLVAGLLAAAASMPLGETHAVTGDASSRELQGAALLVSLVVLAGAAAAAQSLLLRGERVGRLPLRDLASPRRVFAVTAAVAVAIVAVTLLVVSAADSGPVADARAKRLAGVESNRWSYWKVAARGFAREPLAGEGASGFRLAWLRERDVAESVRDAHSLYLETAAELGLAGLAALAAFLAGLGLSALPAWRRDRQLAAGPIAVCGVWLAAAAFDWHWEMPAVTLPALLAAAALLARADALAEAPAAPARDDRPAADRELAGAGAGR